LSAEEYKLTERAVCLTIAPVFFSASIYVTLSKSIVFFAPELSRFKPQLFYWIFIPADIVCLVLQAAGGALSTESGSQVGVDISMAGLILQVIVILVFVVAFADYMVRYWRSGSMNSFGWRLKAFFAGLTAAIILILTRCIYRVAELREGYDGELITHEIPFIILEGVMIVLASIALMWGHPGLAMKSHVGGPLHKGSEHNSVEETNTTAMREV
jgi:RTA1 like protein